MTLPTGTKLSHYEITSQLGKGGMGEVYQATDTKLGRDVAIKVLPEEFAKDTDRVARFQREAKLLASLNHPNIAAIHGLEESDGIHFLVMELIEGQTLDDRIKAGAIPVEEALKLALQITEALEAAHERGVIHRDLKPANIKVATDGKVKVLDFGLAKAFAGEQADLNLSNSPTLSVAATQQGVILGTAAYMSPEQARGKEVDRRADIWAFGVVLFEMLTGKSLFAGEDVSSTLAKVLEREPDFSMISANLNPRLSELLETCLEKNAKRRYHDIADIRLLLEKILADPRGVIVQPVSEVAKVAPASKRSAVIGIAAAVVLAAVSGFAVWMLKPPDIQPVIRWEHTLPVEIAFGNTQFNILTISPEGGHFVYNSAAGFRIRRMDTLEDHEIPAGSKTLLRFSPTLSPNGQALAYIDGFSGQLLRISVAGGAAVPLAPMEPSSLSWEADDTILYYQADGIWQVSASRGEPQRIIKAKADEVFYGPRRLPGSEKVMFTVTRATGINRWDEAEIVVQSPNSEDRRLLWPGGSDARYVTTGHLIYANQGVLFAVPFDPDRLEVTGSPVPMVVGVRQSIGSGAFSGAAFYDITEDGTLVYVPGGVESGKTMLAWIDSTGEEEAIDVPTGNYLHPRISPDGQWLAVERESGDGADIFIHEISGNTEPQRLTEGGNNRYPVWSRDGKYIAFQSDQDGNGGIFRRLANGTGGVDRLTTTESDSRHIPEAWSPTRDVLAFSVVRGNVVELWMLNVEDGSTERFGDIETSGNALFDTVFSIDGEWIAYTQRMDGVSTWVNSVANPETRYQIGQDEETIHHPLWTRDGTQLIYFPGAEPAVAVDIRTKPTFRVVGRPTQVPGIGSPNTTTNSLLNHDAAPDGRFVIVRSELAADGTAARECIIVVTNWFEELKKKVPIP